MNDKKTTNRAELPLEAVVEGYVWPVLAVDAECRVIGRNQAARGADAADLKGMFCAGTQGEHEPDCLLARARAEFDADGFYRQGSDWVFPLCSAGGQRWLVLRREAALAVPPSEEFLGGASAAVATLRDWVRKVASHDLNIVLMGEMGSGRRQVARAIHDAGMYRDGPLEVVNCANLANPYSDQRERIEPPRGGTYFLHEVGRMPMPYQLLLMQALDEGDGFRVIASTREDLRGLMREGDFLEELYYELAMLVIEVPPLRERIEDIPLLVRQMLFERYGLAQMPVLHPEVFNHLAGLELSGNLRELRNLVERAWLLRDREDYIALEAFGFRAATDLTQPPEVGVALPEVGGLVPLKDVERIYLEQIARQYRGSKHRLARQLGVSERTLYRKLSKLRPKESVG